jgi:hypothetical protein
MTDVRFPLIEVRDSDDVEWTPLNMTVFQYCDNLAIQPDVTFYTENAHERAITLTWEDLDLTVYVRYQHDSKGGLVYGAT